MEWYQVEDILIATTMMLVILTPVVGLTVRFSLVPLIEKFASLRSARTDGLANEVGGLKNEVARLRENLARLETDLHRLADVREFNGQLLSASEVKREE